MSINNHFKIIAVIVVKILSVLILCSFVLIGILLIYNTSIDEDENETELENQIKPKIEYVQSFLIKNKRLPTQTEFKKYVLKKYRGFSEDSINNIEDFSLYERGDYTILPPISGLNFELKVWSGTWNESLVYYSITNEYDYKSPWNRITYIIIIILLILIGSIPLLVWWKWTAIKLVIEGFTN